MARVSYIPLPNDLQRGEIDECPPLRSNFGSAQTMFGNLDYFTKEHLVVNGLRVARLQIDLHDENPPKVATLLVRELANGKVEVRRSPGTDDPAAMLGFHHIEAYAGVSIEWP
jgi:hypothetical protein